MPVPLSAYFQPLQLAETSRESNIARETSRDIEIEQAIDASTCIRRRHAFAPARESHFLHV
jgi:hypothetical protein